MNLKGKHVLEGIEGEGKYLRKQIEGVSRGYAICGYLWHICGVNGPKRIYLSSSGTAGESAVMRKADRMRGG